MPTPLPQYNIVGVGDAPASIADLIGLRVRALGGIARPLETLGMETYSMPTSEVAAAPDAGEIDAVALAPHAHLAFGSLERAEWWTTNLNPGTGHCPIAVNAESYEALSPEHKEVLMSATDQALDHYMASYQADTLDRWEVELDDRGIERVTLSQADVDMLRELSVTEVVNDWFQWTSDSGVDGQNLLSFVIDAING